MGQPQRALNMLQGLVDTYTPGEEPQQVLYLEGLAYRALGRYDEAIETLSLACHRGPGSPELYYQLARSQFKAGNLVAAADAAASGAGLGATPSAEPRSSLADSASIPHGWSDATLTAACLTVPAELADDPADAAFAELLGDAFRLCGR